MLKSLKIILKQSNIVVKYFLFYSIFVLSILFGLINNNVLNYIPNISLTLIFFNFIWLNNKNNIYVVLNLFLLGLIIDVYTFLPLFVSSISLLLSYKIMDILKKVLIKDNHFIFLLRDASIFMILFFIIKWFIISYYNTNFYSLILLSYDIISNIIYCIIGYLLFNNYLKDV